MVALETLCPAFLISLLRSSASKTPCLETTMSRMLALSDVNLRFCFLRNLRKTAQRGIKMGSSVGGAGIVSMWVVYMRLSNDSNAGDRLNARSWYLRC